MSIAPKTNYSVSSDAKTLTVKELTGQYSVLNLGGWDSAGTANPKSSEATVAEVRIAKRNSDGTFGVETTVNVYNTLPSDIAGSIDILSSDAGQGGSFSDGVYRFTYVVQGIWVTSGNTPFLTTKTVYVPIIPAICTCWQKKSAEFVESGCGCEKSDIFNTISIYMNLLEKAFECQNLNDIAKFIDKLTELCNNYSCNKK